ncbi:AKT1, partial [Symbiodinium sp. KB8]
LYRLLVMFREMQQSDKTNLIVIMLAKFVTCILLSTHLSACLFWGLARDDGFVENTWVAQGAPHLPGQQWAQRYITSLFWAVGTFKAGPSSGDLVPTSDLEKMLACVVMMCNICLQTYLVSNLSALLTRADVGIYTMRHAAALKGFSMQGKQQDACVAMPGGCIRVLALPREPV